MKLHITHDDFADVDFGAWFVHYILSNANRDPFGTHHPALEPELADAILIVSRGDEYATNLRRHPLVNRYPQKCFVYDVRDRPLDLMPGLYASMPRGSYRPRRHRTAGYFAPINDEVQRVAATTVRPDLLCSFVGGPTSRVRRRLFDANPFGDRTEVVIQNVYGWVIRGSNQSDKADKFRAYAEVTARSLFVLCPRGIGTSSHRLFETLELGRVPVILSDQWIPPTGPDWDTFSIRVPERDWEALPSVLEEYAHRATRMGELARQAWVEWFSPDVQFHRLASWIAELTEQGQTNETFPATRRAMRIGWRRATNATKRVVKKCLGRS